MEKIIFRTYVPIFVYSNNLEIFPLKIVYDIYLYLNVTEDIFIQILLFIYKKIAEDSDVQILFH